MTSTILSTSDQRTESLRGDYPLVKEEKSQVSIIIIIVHSQYYCDRDVQCTVLLTFSLYLGIRF